MPAKTRGLSIFPSHESIIEYAATLRGLQGNTFSPAIQFIIMDWAQLRGITPPSPPIVPLSDGALEAYPPQNPPITILRDAPTLLQLIEASDLDESDPELDPDSDIPLSPP